jgi:hypothetical protein
MDVVFELLVVWRWKRRELLVWVRREVVRVVRIVSHKGVVVRVVRPGEAS